jgi:hypothetical protein
MKRVLIPVILILAVFVSITAQAMDLPDPDKRTFDQAVKELNTPEKVDTWIRKNITYNVNRYAEMVNFSKEHKKKNHLEDGDFWKAIQYPSETYAKRSGVCFDIANFAVYCLRQAGYDAKLLAVHYGDYSYSGKRLECHTHAICVVPVEDGWCVVGATEKASILPLGEYRNLKQVLDGPCYGSYYKIKFIFNYYYKMEGQSAQEQYQEWSPKEFCKLYDLKK